MRKIALFSLFIFLGLLSLSIYQYLNFYDNKLHVIFCDVGEGDAIVIKTPGGSILLVDGGPDGSVLQCLSHHMPFWKRNISMVILTHPSPDSMQGLLYVLDAYTVGAFATEQSNDTSIGYTILQKKLQQERISQHIINWGDRMDLDRVRVQIVGPTDSFKGLASLEALVSFSSFHALLTGDSQVQELQDSLAYIQGQDLLPLHVLQIPDHGSANGINRDVLSALDPRIAVISLGVQNKRLHEDFSIDGLLQELQIPVKRTDTMGDIEIVSDGRER